MAGARANIVGDLDKWSSGDGEKWVDIMWVKVAPAELADAWEGSRKGCVLASSTWQNPFSTCIHLPPFEELGNTPRPLWAQPKHGISTSITSDWSRPVLSLLWPVALMKKSTMGLLRNSPH